jgi:shikimate kinase
MEIFGGGNRNFMKNIILIGMPGAGKSTVGVVLAKRLGFRFLDCDLVIQETEGKLLHEIIREKGTQGFLETEDRINSGICAESAVIATGGSAVYGQAAMQHFAQIGTIVYLSLPYEELAERLGDLHERGVALAPGQTLQSLFEERKPLYEKYGEVVIDCSKKPIREIVAQICQALGA